MGITGTDVAKAAADMVGLTDDDFTSIVNDHRGGPHHLRQHLASFVFFLLSTQRLHEVGMLILLFGHHRPADAAG